MLWTEHGELNGNFKYKCINMMIFLRVIFAGKILMRLIMIFNSDSDLLFAGTHNYQFTIHKVS